MAVNYKWLLTVVMLQPQKYCSWTPVAISLHINMIKRHRNRIVCTSKRDKVYWLISCCLENPYRSRHQLCFNCRKLSYFDQNNQTVELKCTLKVIYLLCLVKLKIGCKVHAFHIITLQCVQLIWFYKRKPLATQNLPRRHTIKLLSNECSFIRWASIDEVLDLIRNRSVMYLTQFDEWQWL